MKNRFFKVTLLNVFNGNYSIKDVSEKDSFSVIKGGVKRAFIPAESRKNAVKDFFEDPDWNLLSGAIKIDDVYSLNEFRPEIDTDTMLDPISGEEIIIKDLFYRSIMCSRTILDLSALYNNLMENDVDNVIVRLKKLVTDYVEAFCKMPLDSRLPLYTTIPSLIYVEEYLDESPEDNDIFNEICTEDEAMERILENASKSDARKYALIFNRDDEERIKYHSSFEMAGVRCFYWLDEMIMHISDDTGSEYKDRDEYPLPVTADEKEIDNR